MTKTTNTTKTLIPGTRVRLPSWAQTVSAGFSTVRASAERDDAQRKLQLAKANAAYAEILRNEIATYTPDAAVQRAKTLGHEQVFTFHGGSVIDNTGDAFREAKAQAAAAVTIQDGEIVAVQGEPGLYRVRVIKGNEGEFIRNCDPIHFDLVDTKPLTMREKGRYRSLISQIAVLRSKGYEPDTHPDFEFLQSELDVLAARLTAPAGVSTAKQERALKALLKAERAAQKAQEARDVAEGKWNAAMAILRPDETGPTAVFSRHCAETGISERVNFGDILC